MAGFLEEPPLGGVENLTEGWYLLPELRAWMLVCTRPGPGAWQGRTFHIPLSQSCDFSNWVGHNLILNSGQPPFPFPPAP